MDKSTPQKLDPKKFKDEAPEVLFLSMIQVVDELKTAKALNKKQLPVFPGHLSKELKEYYPSLSSSDFNAVEARKDFKDNRALVLGYLQDSDYIKIDMEELKKLCNQIIPLKSYYPLLEICELEKLIKLKKELEEPLTKLEEPIQLKKEPEQPITKKNSKKTVAKKKNIQKTNINSHLFEKNNLKQFCDKLGEEIYYKKSELIIINLNNKKFIDLKSDEAKIILNNFSSASIDKTIRSLINASKKKPYYILQYKELKNNRGSYPLGSYFDVKSKTANNQICCLRKILEIINAPESLIKTEPNKGYSLHYLKN